MSSEEIITGLKNAIARKESLEQAMQIMINSGYNAKEVQEASKFIGEGVLSMEEPRPDEQLVMPEQKKGFFSQLKFWKKQSIEQPQKTTQTQQVPQKQLTAKQTEKIQQQTQNIQQAVKSQQIQEPLTPQETYIKKGSLLKQLKKIKPTKQSHLKEIILIIILLILLMVLAVIIFFKGTIFGWFT